MGVGGKANEIKGPVAPQDKSNAEAFETCRSFTSRREVGTERDIQVILKSQYA